MAGHDEGAGTGGAMDPTALDRRPGLPEDLQILLEKYPRADWPPPPDLPDLARMWWQRHEMFRDLGGQLRSATHGYREGTSGASAYWRWFAPRLQFFLSELNAHHHVEDVHYFPKFQAAERRLAHGFELLEGDHETIHRRIERTVETANTLAPVLAGEDDDARRRALDAFTSASDHLLDGLLRHLHDEEDLIVPLILERGEPG
jgi:iron-sulfur cluster repair protein YtfE (RIC family)